MKKSLEISAMFDTSAFDRSVADMQRKLRDIQAPGSGTAGRVNQAGFGSSSDTIKERSTIQYRRELGQFIEKEWKKEQDISKEYHNRLQTVKSLQSEFDKENKGTLRSVELLKNINAAKAQSIALSKQQQEVDENVNDALDKREQLHKQMVQKFGGGMTAIAGLAAFAAGAADQIGGAQFRTQTNTGRAMKGIVGRTIEEMQTPYGQAWMGERAQAASEAKQQVGLEKLKNELKFAAGSAALIGGVATAGTGVGALVAGGGAATLLSSPAMKSLTAFKVLRGLHMPGLAADQLEEYNSKMNELGAQKFGEALTAKQEKNPLKDLAAKDNIQNWMARLQFQRSTGLNYGSFHAPGGFREQMINAGFTGEQGMEQGNQILSAGGSSRMAGASGSKFGLQLQRSMGLTNSGQVLGALSGGMGDSKQTEAATIRILAEAVSRGLGDSKFVEEFRRFSQSTAELIGKTGASSAEDVARLTQQSGAFLADKTTQGVGAAGGAQQHYEQMGHESGPRAAMRWSGMMKDEKLRKLDPMAMQALDNMDLNDITENNPLAVSLAHKAGISVQELASRKKGSIDNSVSRYGKFDKGIATLKKMGLTNLDQLTRDYKKLPSAAQKAYDDITIAKGNDDPEHTLAQRASIQYQLNGSTGKMKPGDVSSMEWVAGHKDRGIMEDDVNKGMAENSRLTLESLQKFNGALTPSAGLIHDFNKNLAEAIDIMKGKKGNSTFMDTISNYFNGQQNAGKESE